MPIHVPILLFSSHITEGIAFAFVKLYQGNAHRGSSGFPVTLLLQNPSQRDGAEHLMLGWLQSAATREV